MLDEELIQRRLKPFLGTARTIQDVEEAAQVLQDLYKAENYPAVFVEIPPQTVVGGVFTLKVVETKLRRIKVTGAHYFLPSLVRESIPSLEKGRPLNIDKLQSDIQFANALNADLKVIPVLTQSPDPEKVDIELSVSDEFPLTGGIEINNYHTATTTPTRLAFDIGYNNLWQKHHTISLQAQTSPEDTEEVKVLAVNYLAPLGLSGNKLAFYAVNSDSDTTTIGNTNVQGDGLILGTRWIAPFAPDSGGYNTIILGFDYKDFDETTRAPGEGEQDDSITQTPISYGVFTAQLSRFTREGPWENSMSLALSLGIRGVFNEDEEFGNKGSGNKANFAILKGTYDTTYRFENGWKNKYAVEVQIAQDPLVSNERLSSGGNSSVRGYFESQITGDTGFITNVELTTPNLRDQAHAFFKADSVFQQLNAYGFWDSSFIQKNSGGTDEDRSDWISSLGLGVSSKFLNQFSADLHAGVALVEEGQGADGAVSAGQIRLRAKLRYDF